MSSTHKDLCLANNSLQLLLALTLPNLQLQKLLTLFEKHEDLYLAMRDLCTSTALLLDCYPPSNSAFSDCARIRKETVTVQSLSELKRYFSSLIHAGVGIDVPLRSRILSIRDSSQHQSIRDVERDSFVIQGKEVKGSTVKYSGVLEELKFGIIDNIVATLLNSGLPVEQAYQSALQISKKFASHFISMSETALRECNRTITGGDSYDALRSLFNISSVAEDAAAKHSLLQQSLNIASVGTLASATKIDISSRLVAKERECFSAQDRSNWKASLLDFTAQLGFGDKEQGTKDKDSTPSLDNATKKQLFEEFVNNILPTCIFINSEMNLGVKVSITTKTVYRISSTPFGQSQGENLSNTKDNQLAQDDLEEIAKAEVVYEKQLAVLLPASILPDKSRKLRQLVEKFILSNGLVNAEKDVNSAQSNVNEDFQVFQLGTPKVHIRFFE